MRCVIDVGRGGPMLTSYLQHAPPVRHGIFTLGREKSELAQTVFGIGRQAVGLSQDGQCLWSQYSRCQREIDAQYQQQDEEGQGSQTCP